MHKPKEEIREVKGIGIRVALDKKHFHIKQPDGAKLRCRYSDDELVDAVVSTLYHDVIINGPASIDKDTNKIIEITDVIDITIEGKATISQQELFDE